MATAGQIPDDKIFEIIVGMILSNSGYAQVSQGRLKGRGGLHQTDAFGDYFIDVPFVHRIELIAEAKLYNRPVSINVGRDSLARVIDVDQHYSFQDYNTRAEAENTRRTIKSAIFSASGFTKTTLKFCYSHGIWCVDFPTQLGRTNLQNLIGLIRSFLNNGVNDRKLSSTEKAVVNKMRREGYWTLSEDEWRIFEEAVRSFIATGSGMIDYRNDLASLIFGMLSTTTPVVIRLPSAWKEFLLRYRENMLTGEASTSVHEGNESIINISVNVQSLKDPIVFFTPFDLYNFYVKTQKIIGRVLYRAQGPGNFKSLEVQGLFRPEEVTTHSRYPYRPTSTAYDRETTE